MIYELHNKSYLNELIQSHGLKGDMSYIEAIGMANTLKVILEEAIDINQEIIIDDKVIVSDNYKYNFEQFDKAITINFDNKNYLLANGYFITNTGKVILNITNYNLVIVLDIMLPYYSQSFIHIYDSIINFDRLNLSYIEGVIYK